MDKGFLERCLADGMTLKQIAAEAGVSTATVSRWIRKFGLGRSARVARNAPLIAEARSAGRTSQVLECPEHGLTAFWIGHEKARCKKCNARGVARRRRKVKEILIEEAGGSCRLCGYRRSQAALQFHHLDPTTKAFGVSAAGVTRSLASSREEASKCILLCSNCHAEVEAGVAVVPLD